MICSYSYIIILYIYTIKLKQNDRNHIRNNIYYNIKTIYTKKMKQVAFYLKREDEKNDLPMKFDKACRAKGVKPNHLISKVMNDYVNDYEKEVLKKYVVSSKEVKKILKEVEDYLSTCSGNHEHDFDIELDNGLVFFSDAIIHFAEIGGDQVPYAELSNTRVEDVDANINYLSDEQIEEIENKYSY